MRLDYRDFYNSGTKISFRIHITYTNSESLLKGKFSLFFVPMTLRFALLNLFFLGVAQWLFVQLTYASPSVQPFLNCAFGVAASCYLLWAYFFIRPRATLRLYLIHLSLAYIIFYFVWSIGIVSATKLASHVATHGSREGVAFFYGTSSVQFLEFNNNSNAFFLFASIPPFAFNILANVILRRWLFSKQLTL